MSAARETDFPAGHPARFDYDPWTEEAAEWARINVHPKGERAFAVDHPKAIDTEGNLNHLSWDAGVDPLNPHLEAFTGRTPEVAERVRQLNRELAKLAHESPVVQPTVAPNPPESEKG